MVIIPVVSHSTIIHSTDTFLTDPIYREIVAARNNAVLGGAISHSLMHVSAVAGIHIQTYARMHWLIHTSSPFQHIINAMRT
jgi:hypothetical protein